MSDEDDIPDFLRIDPEKRKEAWVANPPKSSASVRKGWRSPEQEEAEKKRLQRISDEKRLQRCVSKQKRIIREQNKEAVLEDRKSSALGKEWDARNARWIDPIEAALKKGTKTMTAKKKPAEAKEGEDSQGFGFRK